MDNNWERVQKISAERASPSELRNLVVTFLSLSLICYENERVQLNLVPKQ